MNSRTSTGLSRNVVLATALVAAPVVLTGQQSDAEMDRAGRAEVVTKIAELMRTNYVYPEVAENAAQDLTTRLEAGEFQSAAGAESFAAALTAAIQATTKDKHIRVRVRPPARAAMERDDPAAARAARLERSRQTNFGFERVERLDGNIGYVEMRSFDGHSEAKPTAAAAMNFLANVDAVIFDLRRNGGGSPEMIRYVSSWFFGGPTLLNTLYWRAGDRTDEFWTYDEIPGTARPDVPVFVLTSNRTFSGAEEFSYNMRTQERATLIGEVTGGGANIGGNRPINDRFQIFIPVGAAVNPITGTNWEGVGVEPHIKVAADEALDVALEKAAEAAEAYRASKTSEN